MFLQVFDIPRDGALTILVQTAFIISLRQAPLCSSCCFLVHLSAHIAFYPFSS